MFDRTETRKLTGLTNNQLQSLINEDIVTPVKIDSYINAKSYFDFSQIVELCAINQLKKQAKETNSRITYKMIKEAIKSLSQLGLKESISQNKDFVICFDNGNITIESISNALKMSIAGKNKNQMYVIYTDILSDIETTAIKNNIPHYEEKKTKYRELVLST